MKRFLLLLFCLSGLCITARAVAPSDVILVKSSSKMTLYLPCTVDADRYFEVEMTHFSDTAKHTRLWRLTRAYEVERCGEYEFRNLLSREFIYPGEWACAIKTRKNGEPMPDFMGGFHGYEELRDISVSVDGKELEVGTAEKLTGQTIRIRQQSLMYEYGTDHPLAEHLKEYAVTAEGIGLHQQVTWLETTEVANAYLTMLPIARSLDENTQITDWLRVDGRTTYDVRYSDGKQTVAGSNVRRVEIGGRESGIRATVDVEFEPLLPGNYFFCSMYTPQTGYNKLYFDFCRNHTAQKGAIWKANTLFRFDLDAPKTRMQDLLLNVYSPGNHPMYRSGWIDFNKNDRKDVYEDPTAVVDDRIADLLSQMTLEEKTCQLVTLYGYKRVLQDSLPTRAWKEQLWKDGIGAIDEHLNGFTQWGKAPSTCELVWPASRHAWAINEVQRFFIEQTRLGIPADMTNEGIRGVEAYRATDFPAQLGLGHTWDRDLIRQVGYITGREARLLGYTNVYAPILDVGRDQRWGRYEEVYGESPYLVAELGVAMASGMQTDFQVASTAKHFAAYSNNKGAREGLSRVDPQMSPREVENIHLMPFREVIRRAGILGIMSSYNDYDGVPIQGSRYWLTELLRDEMGFRGYTVSDSGSVEYLYNKHHTAANQLEAVRQSIEAGLNVRCNFWHPETYVLPLRQLYREGRIGEQLLNERVADVLRVKFLVGLFDHPYQNDLAAADREVDSPENNEIALQASRESIVLLKNENATLPLDRKKIRRIAVLGPNADERDFALSHYGPLAVEVTSVLDGLTANLDPQCKVVYEKGCDLVDANWPQSEIFREEMAPAEKAAIARAVKVAAKSDVAIVVLGGGVRTCGENHSRSSLELPGRQEELLRAVKATGKPTILVLINGRPNAINWADAHVDAIVEAWYPGAHGGQAISEVLFGEYNPGGKLTVTFPRHVGQIPFNFPYKPAANTDGGLTPGPEGNQTRINGALYDFGYGLSYTTFAYANLRIEPQVIRDDEPFAVSFDLTNTGTRDGDEVAQLYIRDVVSSVTTYEKNLRGFERVHLKAGETKRISMSVRPQDLSLLNLEMKRVVEPGDFEIMVGASSADIRLKSTLTVSGATEVADRAESNDLPCTLEVGKTLTWMLAENAQPEKIEVGWSEESSGTFEVQLMSGGGQFLTVGRYPIQKGRLSLCRFLRTAASELRIQVTEGTGILEKITIANSEL